VTVPESVGDENEDLTQQEGPQADERSGSAGLEPGQKRVGALLNALAAATRTFLLYDARNDAVKRTLASLLEAFEAALAAASRIRLEVGPFEIFHEGARVYLDRDRERSLAFKLHRDGVRALVFHEGFGQDQLARLLEILSLRYGGIHQHEDDMVTLLWKAGLASLEVIAVEGFAPETGSADDAFRPEGAAPSTYLPEDVDLPLPDTGAEAPPNWLDIEDGTRAVLREQVAAESLPEDCLRLVTLLARGLQDPMEAMPFSEVRPLAEEIRDFLLCAERAPSLVQFIHVLRALAVTPVPWDEERGRGLAEVVASCGTESAVRRLIHTVPASQRKMRPELVEVLDLACPDPFTAVADALAAEEHASGRAIARQLLEHYGQRRAAVLQQRFVESHGRVAADILRSLARLGGEAAAAFLARQCGHPDPEVREEALWHMERRAYSRAQGPALVEAYRRTRGEDRRRVLALIERSRDRLFVEPLAGLVASGVEEPEEAIALAHVVGRLEGPFGLPRWRPWLTPVGRFLRRRLPGSVVQQAAAAAAVAEIPGDEATRLLERALAGAREEARTWMEPLLQERIHGTGRHAA
jgi:hypothetical protein